MKGVSMGVTGAKGFCPWGSVIMKGQNSTDLLR
jgi:hypothetical protein